MHTTDHDDREQAFPGHEVGIRPPNWRMPADIRLGPVRLQVANLARSIEFYERVLGLTVQQQDGDQAELGPSDAGHPPLVRLVERPRAVPVPRRGRLGLYHFALLVPGRDHLGRLVRHLEARGTRPGSADHAVSEALYLYDPDGLGIEVYADRPRDTWQRSGRELVMTTDPLDLESLREAAGAEPWSGMPAGTVVGHLHLSVGDLDGASRFYHDGLGLDMMVWSYPGALFFSAGGYHHHLGTNTWAVGSPAAGESDARLLAWEMAVPAAAVAPALESVERAGGWVERDAAGGWVRDPWGTTLRISAG